MIARLFMGIFLIALSSFAHAQDALYKGRLVPGVWAEEWTVTLQDGLNTSGLLSHYEPQIESMCPGYSVNEEVRKVFWMQLFVSLAWKESLHGPGNWVEFNGGRNNGLYQINPKLRSAYGCDDFDLFDASQNIQCGVKMAKKLVDKFGSFLVGEKGGMAAYWQPLRATNALNTRNRQFILNTVTGACISGIMDYHSRSSFDFVPSFNTIEDLGLDSSELEAD